MHLYNLTLQRPTGIIKVIYGNFSGPTARQILICKSKSVELYRIDELGKLVQIVIEELFCVVRSIVSFRWQAMDHDVVIIGSDSGKIVILQYNSNKGCFVKTHQETFGKSGCRRIVPGQYLAVDPKGRAFMIAAIQKEKFAYSFDRHSDKLVIQSPKDAHKSHVLYLDVVAVDTGNENPEFACIEIEYGQIQDKNALINKGGVVKNMVTYMMNFGENVLVRKKAIELPKTAHLLVPVPNQPNGPGGMLIVCQNYIIYKNDKTEKGIPIPRRKDRPSDRETMITNYVLHKQKELFFFFLQNEFGDIFKLSFDLDNSKTQILSVDMVYFDTIAPCVSMCLSRNGYLFCAGERSDHVLYVNVSNQIKSKPIATHSSQSIDTVIEFIPRQLENLQETDRLESFPALTDIKVQDMTGQGDPQIYALSGANSRSSLKIIKQGLPIKQIGAIPVNKAQNVWTLKSSPEDKYHSYILLSTPSQTSCLSVNESGKVADVKLPAFKYDCPSIHFGLFADGSMIQVLNTGFRHTKRNQNTKQIKLDGQVLRATNNGRQLALAFQGGDISYYEMSNSGDLQLKCVKSIDQFSEATCLDIGPIPPGRQRCNFLGVGLSDHTCRILDLSPQRTEPLQELASHRFPSSIESVAILEMTNQEMVEQELANQLYLYAGLSNGVMMRSTIDTITGNLADTRSRYLGTRPVKLIKSQVLGNPALIVLSSRPWMIYNYMKKYSTSLLSYGTLDGAASFIHANSEVGLIGIRGTPKVLVVQKLGVLFHSQKFPLDYSPRKMLSTNGSLVILEYDERRYSASKQAEIKKQLQLDKLPKQQIGEPYDFVSHYAGQIRVFNPKSKQTTSIIPMDDNEICVSICAVEVTTQDKSVSGCKSFVCVGVIKNFRSRPTRGFDEAFVHVYGWDTENKLTFLHSTPVDDVPFALHGWRQKLLAGVGGSIRSYEIGKKKLLKKAQIKGLSSPVNSIYSDGERIYTTQVGDSFHVYKYKGKEQTFCELADDILPRYTTASALIDYHTMMGADKFQNIYVSRTPPNADQDFENTPNSYKFKWQNGYLNGAPYKMEQVCSFYVGEVVTSMQKASLASTATEIIIYCTINGSICALYPFQSRQDIDFFTHLEMFMRAEVDPLSGRDHLGYRSFHGPCKGVIDGDLCEMYERQSYDAQVRIGKYLDRTPEEVHKKLEMVRNHIL